MASETETPRWKKEKTRLESLSDEDRRANYFCNDDFIGLSDILQHGKNILKSMKNL